MIFQPFRRWTPLRAAVSCRKPLRSVFTARPTAPRLLDIGRSLTHSCSMLVDKRVQRTQSALLDSLMSLMTTHGYRSVSVDALLRRARVARSTFYAHFRGKDDLLRENVGRLRAVMVGESVGLSSCVSTVFSTSMPMRIAASITRFCEILIGVPLFSRRCKAFSLRSPQTNCAKLAHDLTRMPSNTLSISLLARNGPCWHDGSNAGPGLALMPSINISRGLQLLSSRLSRTDSSCGGASRALHFRTISLRCADIAR
jgi:hypothetical protein